MDLLTKKMEEEVNLGFLQIKTQDHDMYLQYFQIYILLVALYLKHKNTVVNYT